MPAGRPPNFDKVVPMRGEDDASGANLKERAHARLDQLRPEGLEDQLKWTFDRLALPLCHPTVNRLSEVNVFLFVQLCRAVVRHEALAVTLDELGETYESETRNGVQWKARPEVAQLNVTHDQIVRLGAQFGMTPSSERGLLSEGQLGFNFQDDPGEEYLT